MYLIQRTFTLLALFAITLMAKPTDLDTLLQGREYQLPPLDTSMRSKVVVAPATGKSSDAGKSSTLFTIQFDALADFDAAQARRADLQRRTGMSIQLVFDSPFYKLRGGSYSRKEDADDQVRSLAEYNIQAFVVKVK